jgi:alpha-glucosidase
MRALLLSVVAVLLSVASGQSWPPYTATPLTNTATGATTSLTAATGNFTDAAYTALTATISTVGTNAVRVQVDLTGAPAANQIPPYAIPIEVFTPPQDVAKAANAAISYSVDQATGAITFTDVATQTTLFGISDLQYGTRYLNFNAPGIDASKSYLSGYGEHDYYYFINHDVMQNPAATVTLSLWNTDNGTPWKNPMYGVHPVVFVANPTVGCFHAIALVNSHAQQMTMSATGLNFYAIGGRLDAFVIRGGSMLEVIQAYHLLISKPAYVPPYWSLGTHQCRWGYKNISDLAAIVAGYHDASLPLEVMWSDIDYMDQFRIFTTDPVNFNATQLAGFIANLHQMGQKYVQIIDPGVAQANYSVYFSGLRQGVYVNTSDGKSPLVNVVWPGWTVFPDFTSDRVGSWWQQELATYLQTIAIDGVWLDMNELGTFCNGACPVGIEQPWTWNWLNANWTKLSIDVCLGQGHCAVADSPLNSPTTTPLTNGNQLTTKTLDMTGKTSMGDYYDTKAFYGMMEELQTHKALSNIRAGERPFILSRASFLGSGQFTSHWTGDNNCEWAPRTGGIADSIQGCLAANLWGITQVGADIGGFNGVPEQQLLTRWTQLGAFYTFMRNHHGLDTTPGQEPYRFAAEAVDTMRTAMQWRYQLLPTIFHELAYSHYYGGPAMRHLSVNFPFEAPAYAESTNFMLGSRVLVIPVVAPNATSVSAYVPSGNWYRLRPTCADEGIIVGGSVQSFASSVYNDTIPVLVRQGTALAVHTQFAMTVQATQQSGISLLCFLDGTGVASGSAILDMPNSAPLPVNASDAPTLTFSCVGGPMSGSVTVVLSGSSAQAAPTAPGFVTVRFAQALTGGATPNAWLADGRKASSAWTTASTLTFTLPTGDFSTGATLLWNVNAPSTPAPSAPSPGADGGDDESSFHISKGAFIASLFGGAVLGGLAIGVLVHLKHRSASRNEYGTNFGEVARLT